MHIFGAGDDRILYGCSAERVMIRRTFLLLPGIGQLKERRLWETGVLSWEEFLERRHLAGVSVQRKEGLDQELGVAKEFWDRGRTEYFTRLLPSGLDRLHQR